MNTQATKTEAETIAYNTAECAALFNKGLQRVVEMSKSSLDLAIEQNAGIVAFYKQALQASSVPDFLLIELAGSSVEDCLKMQKNLLTLAAEQSLALIDTTQEYYDRKMMNEVPAVIQEPVEQAAAVQNPLPEPAKKQAELVQEIEKQENAPQEEAKQEDAKQESEMLQPSVAATPAETEASAVPQADTVAPAKEAAPARTRKTPAAKS